ncbi:hypothetical protein PS15p_211179 [Mucor circinelloides]
MVSLQEPKELLETTGKIANKLVQQIQLLKQRSKKCGAPERSEGQRLVLSENKEKQFLYKILRQCSGFNTYQSQYQQL